MCPDSRVWRLVLPLALSLVGCRGPVERDIDSGDEARLAQMLASPEGQAKLAARGDQWLMRAVRAGQAESVRALLGSGGTRGGTGPQGRALLSQTLAIEDPRAAVAVLRVLVRHGVRPTAPDAQGRTVLHEALERRRPYLVRELLALSPDVEDFDAHPARLLVRAAELGDLESVQGLVRAGVLLEDAAWLSAPLPPDLLRALRVAHLRWLLERAALAGDGAAIRELATGTVAEVWNALGLSPAHLAVLANDRPRLSAVLLADARGRDAGDDRGWTALHLAALVAEPRLVPVLLQGGVDLEARTPGGRTPLMLAAQAGRARMVRELLARGARVNAEDVLGQSALSLAARGGHADVVDALLGSGALLVRERFIERAASEPLRAVLTRAHARFLLRWAVETGGRAEEVRLRREGVSLETDAAGSAPFREALLGADLPALEALAVSHEADFARLVRQREGRTLLHWAVLGGSEACVAWLLDQGAARQAREPARGAAEGVTPLRLALEEGQLRVAALLVARGAGAEGEGEGAAPEEGRRLLARARSNTALLAALREGRLEALPGLLEEGAVEGAAVERLAPTALAWRLLRGDPLAALTRRELDAERPDAGGDSPLHYAAAAGNVRAVEKLLTLGAAVSPRDKAGVTPLGYAARRGDVPTVRRLLEARASAGEPAGPGTSALEAALCASHPEAALLLLARAGSQARPPACLSRAVLQALTAGEEGSALSLLEQGKPGAKDVTPELALAVAAHDGARVMGWLFEHHEALVQAHAPALLETATRAGAGDTVALLLERVPGFDARRLQEVARTALVAGRSGVARLALDRGVDALSRGREESAERLVGATPDSPREVSLAGLALALGAREFLEHLRERAPEAWKKLQSDLSFFPLAVRGGQLEFVRRYVEMGANLLGEDATGAPLLGAAGTEEVAAYLFEHGAILEPPPPLEDSTEPSLEPEPPFAVAVSRGHFGVGRFFLSRGARARVAPVFVFLDQHRGQEASAEALGADTLQALGRLFQEPAWTVAQRGELVEQLAQRFCDAPALFESALSRLSAAQVAERTGSALLLLTRCADTRSLEVLVRRGADPHAVDGSGRDVLTRALHAGHAAGARALLALGVKPLASQGDPFVPVRLALEANEEGLARRMLELGLKAGPDGDGLDVPRVDAALPLALRARAWTLAARLLSRGASVRAVGGDGPLALALASREGRPWMAALLLEMGATDPSGAALAAWVAEGDEVDAWRLLSEGRVPADDAIARLGGPPPGEGAGEALAAELLREWTRRVWGTLSREQLERLLWLAVSRDDDALTTFLVEQAHLDVRLQDGEGKSLLHRAAGRAGPRLVEYLVAQGARLDAEAPGCLHPLDVARERADAEGHEVARWLEAQGATPGGCGGRD